MELARASRVAVLLGMCACIHKAPRFEHVHTWRWVDVGRKCTLDSPAFDLPAAKRDSITTLYGPNEMETWGQRAMIARKVPGGWGGYAPNRKGQGIAIHLIDTTQRKAAIEALKAAGVQYITDSTEVKQGRWTYVQLYEWYRYVGTHLRGIKVNMWTIDDYNERILFGVQDEEDSAELDRRISGLTVPCFLFGREIVGEIRLLRSDYDRYVAADP
jgi:hypothetical protein